MIRSLERGKQIVVDIRRHENYVAWELFPRRTRDPSSRFRHVPIMAHTCAPGTVHTNRPIICAIPFSMDFQIDDETTPCAGPNAHLFTVFSAHS